MDDIKNLKNFEEEFPDIFSGASALIDSRLKKQESQMDSLIETKLAAREFREALTKAYPNWQQIWRSAAFQQFLSEPDPDSLLEYPRYVWVEDAFKRFDSRTVLRAFETFFSWKSKTTASPGHGRSGSGFTQIQEARKRLKELASEKSRGLWNGREAEYKKTSDGLIKIITGQE